MKQKTEHRKKLRMARRMNGGLQSNAFLSEAWNKRKEERVKKLQMLEKV